MHRHRWHVVEKSEQPSSAEMAKAVGTPLTLENAWPDQVNAVMRRPVIVHLRCDCGAEKVERV